MTKDIYKEGSCKGEKQGYDCDECPYLEKCDYEEGDK